MSAQKPQSRRTPAPSDAAVLRHRAVHLARRRLEEKALPRGREVFEFFAGGDAYALPVSILREVQPIRSLTPLPGTPGFVRGIIAVRGQVVSVLDLRVLLGLSPPALTSQSAALVLENEAMTFSLLADQVGEIRYLPDQDLEAGEPSLAAVDRRYIAGVTRECVVLIDGEKLLSDPALVVSGRSSP